jgi:hypothetical protein
VRGLRTRGRIGRERVHDGGVEARRNRRIVLARRRHLRRAHDVEEGHVVVGLEEATHREHLPDDDAERVDVAAPIDPLPLRLLGRHEPELALEDARGALLGEAARLRDAEVDELDVPRRRHEHVLGAHVAMHEVQLLAVVVGGLVRGVEPGGDLRRDPHGHVRREPLPLVGERAQQVRERDAVHVLHREEVRPAIFAELLDVHDVRVRDANGEVRFVDEHPPELRRLVQVRVNHLDGDVSREPRRAETLGQVERRHASGPETLDDLVVPDPIPSPERRHAWRVPDETGCPQPDRLGE